MSGVGTLWDCVPRVCGGGGGCAGGGVPLGAVPVLSWCGEVSLGRINHHRYRGIVQYTLRSAGYNPAAIVVVVFDEWVPDLG